MRLKSKLIRLWATLAAAALVSGCGGGHHHDTCSVVADPNAPGPVITFFGLTRADDVLIEPSGMDNGIPIYTRNNNTGSGFSLVVEAKRGANGVAVGQSSFDQNGGGFPDLQIESSNDLGDGSSSVCDDPQTMPGGVPGIDPACFEADQNTIDAVNDFACRFMDGAGVPTARTVSSDSCVAFTTGDYAFVNPETEAQYCGAINVPLAFPKGDTIVTARVRDVDGNVGPEQQLIVRVTS